MNYIQFSVLRRETLYLGAVLKIFTALACVLVALIQMMKQHIETTLAKVKLLSRTSVAREVACGSQRSGAKVVHYKLARRANLHLDLEHPAKQTTRLSH